MTHFDIEMDTSVALIWLDNPTERVNVLTQAMLAEFSDVLYQSMSSDQYL